MRPCRIVIFTNIFTKQIFEMPFIERNDVIKQFPAKDANNSLTNTILPRAVIACFLGFDISVIKELLKV